MLTVDLAFQNDPILYKNHCYKNLYVNRKPENLSNVTFWLFITKRSGTTEYILFYHWPNIFR